MTIEVLYPELCQLFGDSANVRYLRQCLPGAQFVFTDNRSEPLCVRQKVDLLYIGSMSEPAQMLAVSRLRPYIPQLRALIDDGVAVLVTGNAIELFGQAIEDVSGSHEEMLGMYRFITRRDMEHRHNSMFLGSFENMTIVGCKSQFSFLYGEFPGEFIRVTGGFGNHPASPLEGFRERNLFATYLLGPLLVLNPPFTRYLLRRIGADGSLAFEKEVMEAYSFRTEQLQQAGVTFKLPYHH